MCNYIGVSRAGKNDGEATSVNTVIKMCTNMTLWPLQVLYHHHEVHILWPEQPDHEWLPQPWYVYTRLITDDRQYWDVSIQPH